MKVDIKLRVLNRDGEAFLGPGPVALLEAVGRLGSIRRAAKEMDMSYAKALRLVKTLEANTGHPLVLRSTGGPDGGGSELTDEARSLIGAFRRFQEKVLTCAEREFERSLKESL